MIIFLLKFMKEKKISKYISKDANVFEFVNVSLLVLLASRIISVLSFEPLLSAPLGLLLYFLLHMVVLSNYY